MKTKTECLVLDSAPIIKSAKLIGNLSEEFITVPEVLAELKDKTTRETLEILTYKISTKTPSEEAMKYGEYL
jgi:RNA-binding protein NOB1